MSKVSGDFDHARHRAAPEVFARLFRPEKIDRFIKTGRADSRSIEQVSHEDFPRVAAGSAVDGRIVGVPGAGYGGLEAFCSGPQAPFAEPSREQVRVEVREGLTEIEC